MFHSSPQTWEDGWAATSERSLSKSGKERSNVVMEWIEQGLDMLTCDDERSRGVAIPQHQGQSIEPVRDYDTLHDEFLESLLQEQAEQALAMRRSSGDSIASASSSSTFQMTPDSMRRGSSMSTDIPFPPGDGKRRRPLKLHRHRPHLIPQSSPPRSPGRRQRLQVAPIPPPRKLKYSDDDESLASFSDLAHSERKLPPAASFLSPHVRMQKDKGKGEKPGLDICARGQNECLIKLRQKMELLTQVAFGDTQATKTRPGGAHMKRRKALVSEENEMYTETRSVIELRMGFLSMQYGVLLRWTHGKVQLIVLRKMCSDSFYKTLKVHRGQPSQATVTVPICGFFQSALNLSGKNHAIVDERDDGMEVSLLEPPYRVPRPDEFQESFLKLSVLCIEGWKEHKSSYSLQFHVEGIVEKCRLIHHKERNLHVPSMPATMEWEVPLEGQLDILLYENKRTRHKRKRLLRKLPVPVSSLSPQPTPARPRKLVLPLDDQGAKLLMLVAYHSDYAHWLQREVEARKREETSSGFLWNESPFRGFGSEPTSNEKKTKGSEFSLYQFCCVW